MTLNRRLLAKVDGRLRSEMDHSKGVQLVKVPTSDAVRSTSQCFSDETGKTGARLDLELAVEDGLSVLELGQTTQGVRRDRARDTSSERRPGRRSLRGSRKATAGVGSPGAHPRLWRPRLGVRPWHSGVDAATCSGLVSSFVSRSPRSGASSTSDQPRLTMIG